MASDSIYFSRLFFHVKFYLLFASFVLIQKTNIITDFCKIYFTLNVPSARSRATNGIK